MSNYSFLQQDPRFLQQQQQRQNGSGSLQPQSTGFMQPQQTGFMQLQRTGYMQPQAQQAGFMQPQTTGFAPGGMVRPQQAGYMQTQATGFPSAGGMMGVGMPPMPALPSQYQGQQQTNLAVPGTGINSRFMGGASPSPLPAQPTGYGGIGYGQSPALGALSQPFLNTFMPAQPQTFGGSLAPSQMQFAQPQQPGGLQQTFQTQNQQQIGQAEVKVPWKLSPEEKRSYDQIFRAWDPSGSGFIEGRMSVEVFAQSGLPRDDLMKIWSLADVENRGKLNLTEFHVAMGLIYRRLNGNPIPDTLPPELTPPSARDLDNSVDFLKDLLKRDTNVGSTAGETRGPVRSLHSPAGGDSRKDATMYRHDDDTSDGSERAYKSRSRHIDRRNVRYAGQDKTAADLNEMKRELDKTDSLLDSSRRQDEDDDGLDQEQEDLKYRIRRIQDDIEYITRSGRRSEAKDDERRKLERELLRLRHDDLPELERKIEDRDRERRRDAGRYARERDARNNRSRFDDGRSYGGRDSPDRGYLRGSYDRDTPSRGSYGRDAPSWGSYDHDVSSRGSFRDRDDRDQYDRRRDRSPPPPPPAPPTETKAAPPPPAHPVTTAPPKTMTAEEKKAFIQAEAQRRIQERLRSLGIGGSPSPTPAVDADVASRLEKEKREAAERAAKADKDAEEREKQRQIRLEEERLSKIRAEEELKNRASKAVSQTKENMGANIAASKDVPSVQTHSAMQVEISEEQELRAREEALARDKAARLARIKQLEEEETEAQRLEEEFRRKMAMFGSRGATAPPTSGGTKKAPPPPPASRARGPALAAPASKAPPPAVPKPPATPIAPVAPVAPVVPTSHAAVAQPTPPPAPTTPLGPTPLAPAPLAPAAPSPPVAPPTPATNSTNPFHRLAATSSAPSSMAPSATLSGNPFFPPDRAAAAPATPAPPPVAPALPATVAASGAASRGFKPPPRPADSDDEWDAVKDKSDDDNSSDEEGAATGRQARAGLAQALFGGLMPSRPSSTAPGSPGAPSAPSAPPAPPAAPDVIVIKPAKGPVDRGALLSQIQGGSQLKKTQTNDRSGAQGTGKVISDASALVQHYLPPPLPPASPPAPPVLPPAPMNGDAGDSGPSKRQSVDWYGGMAVDGLAAHRPTLESFSEEPDAAPVPPLTPPSPTKSAPPVTKPEPELDPTAEDAMADFDMTTTVRVRTLYPYEAQRPEDLEFGENIVVAAHPSKTDGDWWHGTVETTGKSGTFPRLYVDEIHPIHAKALYDYEASSDEEISLTEGATVVIVDSSDADWFKAELSGRIGLVPAAYVEIGG